MFEKVIFLLFITHIIIYSHMYMFLAQPFDFYCPFEENGLECLLLIIISSKL